MNKHLKLYKVINGKRRLIDYGVESQAVAYHKQGYILVRSRFRTPVYRVLEAKFAELWATLSEAEQIRLGDLLYDKEMCLEEKFMLLKSEILSRPKPKVQEVEEKPFWGPAFKAWGHAIKKRISKFTDEILFKPVWGGKEEAYA